MSAVTSAEVSTTTDDGTTTTDDGTVSFENADPPRVGREVTATLTDDDNPQSITWAWQRVPSTGAPTALSGTANTYTPVAADVGASLRATATYTDDDGPGQTATGTTPAVIDTGTITLSPSPPRTCEHLEATLVDGDGGINTESAASPPGFPYGWRWIPQTSSSRSPAATSTTQSYLPGNSLVGQTIRVTVQYGDNASDRNTATTTSGVVQANVPRTPTGVASTPGDGRVSLSWTAPNACGSPITGYAYRYRKTSESTWPGRGTTTAPSVEITGLDNDVAYRFEIKAVNAQGESAAATRDETPGTATVTFENADPPQVGRAVTATLTDNDNPQSITWAWQRVPSTGDPTALTGTANTYTPVAADVGDSLRATATYTDDDGPGQTATGTTPPVVHPPGTITLSPSPPRTCEHLEATLVDGDGGINTESAASPPGFPYGWRWIPQTSSSRSPAATSTTQSYLPGNSLVGQTIRVTVQYGDNASDRNTATTTSGVVQANVPRTPTGVASTPGDGRVSLSWTAPNACGSPITGYAYRYRKTSESTWPGRGTTTAPSVEITGLENDVAYRFEIKAVNAQGESAAATRDETPGTDSPGRVTFENADPPRVGQEVTATLTDDDNPHSITWSWQQVPSTGAPTALSGTANTYTPVTADAGHRLRATASYTDDDGPGQTAMGTTPAVEANTVGTITLTNADPPQVTVQMTATLADPDVSAEDLRNMIWTWDRVSPARGRREPRTINQGNTYTPGAGDQGHAIQVTAFYDDDFADGNRVRRVTPAVVGNHPTLVRISKNDPAENTETEVGVYEGSDPQNSALTWGRAGKDRNSFSLRTVTDFPNRRALHFRMAPDYETQHIYSVTVQVTDPEDNTASYPETARVTNVVEAGTISLAPTAPQTCAHTTGTLRDEDGGITTAGTPPAGFTYGWTWDPASASSSRTAGTSTTQSYLPPNSAVGQTVTVTVRYGDNAADRNTVTKTSGTVRANSPRSIPRFTATGGRGRVDLSWTAPNDCGASVTYTYEYRLSGSTPWTTRTTTSTSAEITSLAAGTYEFELTAGNSAGTSGTKTETATVTAVNQPPTVTGPANPVTVPEGTRNVGTYNATDPNDNTVTWDLEGTDDDDLTLPPDGMSATLAFDEAPNYEVDARSYSVSVKATDPHGAHHSYPVTIAIGNEDDPGVVTISPDSPRVGETVSAALSDEDGGVSGDPWAWSSETAASRGEDGQGDSDRVPRVGDTWTAWKGAVGRYLVASRTYSDNHGSGKSASGRSKGVVRPNKPKAPPDFEAVRGDGQVSLSWGKAEDQGAAIDYYQYRRSPGSASWSTVDGDGGARSQTVTDLTNGTTYTFYVRAHNSAGDGASASVQARPAGKPDAPSGFSHGRSSANSVTVSWDEPEDNGSPIIDYYWSKRGTFFWDSEATVTSTEFTDSSSPNSGEHRYRVRARNSVGPGSYGYYTVPAEEQRSARFKPLAAFVDSTGFGVLTAPNPFNSQTLIHLALPEDAEVTLSVHSLTGQAVARLHENHPLEAGIHTLQWRGVDDRGRPVGSGIYLFRVIAGDKIHLGKLALIR